MDKSEEKEELKGMIISSMAEEGKISVEWREGQASVIDNEKPVHVRGCILSAPYDFLKQRKDVYLRNETNAVIDYEELSIVLTTNEHKSIKTVVIEGKIQFHKQWVELGINTGKAWTHENLAKRLKMMRSFFQSNGVHGLTVGALKDLKTKVMKDMQDSNDERGNLKKTFDQLVETNCPESFTLSIPIIKGSDPVEVEIEILFEVINDKIQIYLESVQGQEIVDDLSAALLTQEAIRLREFATVIEK